MPTPAKSTPESRRSQAQVVAAQRHPEDPTAQEKFLSLYDEAGKAGKGGYRHKSHCVCGQCHRTRLCVAASMMKPKHKRRRSAKSKRQDKFIEAYTDPHNAKGFGNGEQAALAAGYAPHIASAQADSILSDEQVRGRVFAALERLDVHDDFIAKRCMEGMLAKSSKYFQHNGKVVKSPPFIDWAARHKFLETTMRARGDFPNEERQMQAIILKIGSDIPTAQGWDEAVKVEVERVSNTAPATD